MYSQLEENTFQACDANPNCLGFVTAVTSWPWGLRGGRIDFCHFAHKDLTTDSTSMHGQKIKILVHKMVEINSPSVDAQWPWSK